MPSPGLLLVFSRVKKDSTIKSDQFQRWYDEVHLPDVLATSGINEGYRYNNVDPKAPWQFMAAYPVEDSSFLGSDEFNAIPAHGKHVFPGIATDYAEFEVRFYDLIQIFEPRGLKVFGNSHSMSKSPTNHIDKSSCIISVSMEPEEGTDSDFDDWYRKQHLDVLSMVDPYRCTSRYQLKFSSGNETPKYLALHEFETTNLPNQQIGRASLTEWSKRILERAKAFQPLKWTFVKSYGQQSSKYSSGKL